MRAEEREDALAGIVRRGLLVSGSDEPAQDREQDRRLVCGAFGSVHAASLGRRISAGHEPGPTTVVPVAQARRIRSYLGNL